MNRHHSIEERLSIVSRIISGETVHSLSKSLGIDKHLIRQWYLRYQRYGEKGLEGTRSSHHSETEKTKIVEEITVKGIPLHEVCLRHNLSRSILQTWLRKARNGIPLENKRLGRPPKRPMGRPKKKEPQTELEKLQAENLRLRAENALLKKVKALVEEQEARARLNGRKPSTN